MNTNSQTMMALLRSKEQQATSRGKAFPLGAPCGVACGQALQPCGLSGGLTTASRLRRACTPFCHGKIQRDKNQIRFRGGPDTASTGQGITYLSGKRVQSLRTTSDDLDTPIAAASFLEATLLTESDADLLNVMQPLNQRVQAHVTMMIRQME